jgi:hypothetical protein
LPKKLNYSFQTPYVSWNTLRTILTSLLSDSLVAIGGESTLSQNQQEQEKIPFPFQTPYVSWNTLRTILITNLPKLL